MDLLSGLFIGLIAVVIVSVGSGLLIRKTGRTQRGMPFYLCFLCLALPYVYVLAPNFALEGVVRYIVLALGVAGIVLFSQYFCGQQVK